MRKELAEARQEQDDVGDPEEDVGRNTSHPHHYISHRGMGGHNGNTTGEDSFYNILIKNLTKFSFPISDFSLEEYNKLGKALLNEKLSSKGHSRTPSSALSGRTQRRVHRSRLGEVSLLN